MMFGSHLRAGCLRPLQHRGTCASGRLMTAMQVRSFSRHRGPRRFADDETGGLRKRFASTSKKTRRSSLKTDRWGEQRRIPARGPPPRPTIDEVRASPRFVYEYSNEMLFYAARDTDAHDIHQERLIREIMIVDEIEYDEAAEVMRHMFRYNNELSKYLMIPFHAGLAFCAVSAVGCVPLVFNYTAATNFADLIAASPEEPISPDTAFSDIGTWTWAWMEPIIGTASFSILCLQLLRSAMINLAYRPVRDSVMSYRANALADAFPQFDRPIVKDFGRSQPMRYIELGPGFRSYLTKPDQDKLPRTFPRQA